MTPHFLTVVPAETLYAGKIKALDVSSCCLSEKDLRTLTAPIQKAQPLQLFDISKSLGRLPASVLPSLLWNLVELKELNLRGSLLAEEGVLDTLIPFSVLQHLEHLEALDISGLKVWLWLSVFRVVSLLTPT